MQLRVAVPVMCALWACGPLRGRDGGMGGGEGGGGGASAGGGGGTAAGGGGASGGDAGCVPKVPAVVVCDGGACPVLMVSGDAYSPAATSGNFRGYGDPSLADDATAPGRVWLAYSYLQGRRVTAPDGGMVGIGSVSSHLARSDDQGRTFTLVRELYASVPTNDPEGSGEQGLHNSETVSLVHSEDGGTWYAAHLRYFQRPIAGYNPKYGTSWTVRIGAAASPAALGDAPATTNEAVLGVSGTAAVYNATVRLDQLAGLPRAQCALLNNPTLWLERGTLYLVVECLSFVGVTLDFATTTTQVFATTPNGSPPGWTWRSVGKLADVSLARELGSDTVQQFDLARGLDGTLLLLVATANADAAATVGTVSNGCAVIELDSLDPPAIRRDCNGAAVVRTRLTRHGLGSCTYHRASQSGVLGHSQIPAQPFDVLVSGSRP